MWVCLEKSFDSCSSWVEDEEAGSIVRRERAAFLGLRSDFFRVIGGDADRGPDQVVSAEVSGLGHSVGADPVHDQILAVAGLLFESEDLLFGKDGLVEHEGSSVRERKQVPTFVEGLGIRMFCGKRVLPKPRHLAKHRIDESRRGLVNMLANPVH